jgi:hypothetical protein
MTVCKRCTFTEAYGPHKPAKDCKGCRAPLDHHEFEPEVDPRKAMLDAINEIVLRTPKPPVQAWGPADLALDQINTILIEGGPRP